MKEKPMVMGCYGIGISRTMAAVVEQHHDENGMIWPMSLAPYEAVVTIVNIKNEEQVALAESIYQKLLDEKIEVLLDDRKERVGVKFKDADLIGIPIRITVGKMAPEGIVEYQLRKENEKSEFKAPEAIELAIKCVRENK